MSQLWSHQAVLANHIEWLETPGDRARGMLKYSSAPFSTAFCFKMPLGGALPLIHTVGMNFSIDILFCDQDLKVLARAIQVAPSRFVLPKQVWFKAAPWVIEMASPAFFRVQVGEKLLVKSA